MNSRTALFTVIALFIPSILDARSLSVLMGTPVRLVTAQPLSSKIQVKGELVALLTAEDVVIDGVVAIPKGTAATGQVSDARMKGTMGMGGRLTLRPLYLRLGNQTVRLTGSTDDSGGVQPGAVIGTALVAPFFTGKSAVIPEGSSLQSYVAKTVVVGD